MCKMCNDCGLGLVVVSSGKKLFGGERQGGLLSLLAWLRHLPFSSLRFLLGEVLHFSHTKENNRLRHGMPVEPTGHVDAVDENCPLFAVVLRP